MSTKTDWFSIIYSSLFFVGITILLISLFTSSVATTIAGYSILVVSVILITTYLYNQISTSATGLSFLWTVFMNLGPFVLILGILLYSLSLNIIYMNEIQAKHVADQYYVFSTLSILFILAQLLFFVYGIQSPEFQQRRQLPSIYGNLSYFVGVINVYILVSINTILKYYITDG